MSKHTPKIILTLEEANALNTPTSSRSAEFRQVERARIILACADGKQNKEVAKEAGVTLPTVSKWRKRFLQQGLPDLRDAEHSGKPVVYGAEFRNRLFELMDKDPPTGMACWCLSRQRTWWEAPMQFGCSWTKKVFAFTGQDRGVSAQIQSSLQSCRTSWFVSYPPINTLDLSVDEKSSIQAKERATGFVETRDKKFIADITAPASDMVH